MRDENVDLGDGDTVTVMKIDLTAEEVGRLPAATISGYFKLRMFPLEELGTSVLISSRDEAIIRSLSHD